MRNRYFIFIIVLLVAVFVGYFEGAHRKSGAPSLIAQPTVQAPSPSPARSPSSDALSPFVTKGAIKRDDFEESLNLASARPWEFVSNERGRVQKITGGSLPFAGKNLADASRDFFGKYGDRLFGINSKHLILRQLNEKGFPKTIIYQQTISGVPVYQSRVALFFDEEMNLVHAHSDGNAADLQHDVAPKISATVAAQAALLSLRKNTGGLGMDNLTVGSLEKKAEYFVFISGDVLANVYRFSVELSEPNSTEREVLVGAADGRIVFDRIISRK